MALPRAGTRSALGDGARVGARAGADGDGNIGGCVAGVGNIDGDQLVAGRGGGEEDALDGEVGQALVGIDPVGEEPGEVGVVFGGFEKFFEGTAHNGVSVDGLAEIVDEFPEELPSGDEWTG